MLGAMLILAQAEPMGELEETVIEAVPLSKYHVESVSTALLLDVPPEELPVTIDVLTDDYIKEANPHDLHDLLRTVPGIYTGGKTFLDRTSGQYTIRGMSGSEATIDGSLGLAGPMGTFMDTSALERVELAKGPVGSTQGGAGSTLGAYGAGGSVNLVMKSARLHENFSDYHLQTNFGSDMQRYQLGGDINRSLLDDRLAIRLPFNFDIGQSFWASDYPARESYFFAPSITYAVRDDLRLGMSMSYQYLDQPGYQGIPIYQGKPLPGFNWDSNLSTEDMRDRYHGLTLQAYVEYDANDRLQYKLGAGISRASLDFEHLGSSAYAGGSYDQKPLEHQAGDSVYQQNNIYARANAMLSSGNVDHQVLMQADFNRKVRKGYSFFTSVPEYDPGWSWSEDDYQYTRTDRLGFLVQDYMSWNKWRALAGIRYDYHKSHLGNTANSFSPRGGLSYLASDRVILFGNISLTESPNFGYMSGVDEELTDSWRAVQYEAGMRYSPIESLWFSGSVYQIDQRGFALAIPDSNYYETEGEVRSQGLELSVTGEISDDLSVYAAYAYNDYRNLSTGSHFDRHPPHSFTGRLSYRIPAGYLQDVLLGVSYRYRDQYSTTHRAEYISEDHFVKASHVFDASMSMALSKFGGSDKAELTFRLNNIFNERYIESNRHYYQAFPGDPRNFEIAIRTSF